MTAGTMYAIKAAHPSPLGVGFATGFNVAMVCGQYVGTSNISISCLRVIYTVRRFSIHGARGAGKNILEIFGFR